MKEIKCSACGKPVTDIDHCICDSCFNRTIDRILQQARDKRLKQEETVASVGELKEKVNELNKEKNRLLMENQEIKDKLLRFRKQVVKAYCELFGISYLYYMTPWENLESILQNGLLCLNLVKSNNINYVSMAIKNIQEVRSERNVNGRSANDFVPLFFSPKTPMLSKVKHENLYHQEKIVYICINSEILGEEGVCFSDGNVANHNTKIYCDLNDLRKLHWKIIRDTYWKRPNVWEEQEAKRIKSAEVLVPERVDPCRFQKIVVYDKSMADFLRARFSNLSIPIEVNREFYF